MHPHKSKKQVRNLIDCITSEYSAIPVELEGMNPYIKCISMVNMILSFTLMMMIYVLFVSFQF